MKFAYKDKNGRYVKDGHTLKFRFKDKVEKSGYSEFERLVRNVGGILGFYSPEEKRVIPFREQYDTHIINDAEVI